MIYFYKLGYNTVCDQVCINMIHLDKITCFDAIEASEKQSIYFDCGEYQKSDYDTHLLFESNYEYLKTELESPEYDELKTHITRNQIFLPCWILSDKKHKYENLREMIEGLESYPVFDEAHYSDYKCEKQSEWFNDEIYHNSWDKELSWHIYSSFGNYSFFEENHFNEEYFLEFYDKHLETVWTAIEHELKVILSDKIHQIISIDKDLDDRSFWIKVKVFKKGIPTEYSIYEIADIKEYFGVDVSEKILKEIKE
jgi:hypothetical protein